MSDLYEKMRPFQRTHVFKEGETEGERTKDHASESTERSREARKRKIRRQLFLKTSSKMPDMWKSDLEAGPNSIAEPATYEKKGNGLPVIGATNSRQKKKEPGN